MLMLLGALAVFIAVMILFPDGRRKIKRGLDMPDSLKHLLAISEKFDLEKHTQEKDNEQSKQDYELVEDWVLTNYETFKKIFRSENFSLSLFENNETGDTLVLTPNDIRIGKTNERIMNIVQHCDLDGTSSYISSFGWNIEFGDHNKPLDKKREAYSLLAYLITSGKIWWWIEQDLIKQGKIFRTEETSKASLPQAEIAETEEETARKNRVQGLIIQ